jgi:hypothetical protein
MSNLDDVSTEDLVASLFQGEVQSRRNPEQIRQRLLAHLDEQIEKAKALDQVAMNVAHAVFGTLAMGGMVMCGVWDKDGAEVFRWLKDKVGEMDVDDLAAVEFE